MKKFYLTLLTVVMAVSSAFAAMSPDFFHKRSLLSQGKWIKISVDKTGIYEISYEMLRQMGFPNPEKVGVFGRGGLPLYPSLSNSSDVVYTDDISAVKIWHHNNKIYFLGIGPKDAMVQLQSSSVMPLYYTRDRINIYTDKGVYFLSDSQPSDLLQVKQTDSFNADDDPTMLSECVSHIYHEEDLVQNNSKTGQLFWERNISSGSNNQLLYDINIPDAIPNSTGMIYTDIYLNLGDNDNATLSYGLVDDPNPYSFKGVPYATSYFKAQQPQGALIGINPGKQRVFFKITGDIPTINALDYWVLSYKSHIPSLRNVSENQARFAFSGLKKGKPSRFSVSDASSYVVLNNSRPDEPEIIMPYVATGESSFQFEPTSSYSDMWIFDPSRPQLQVTAFADSFSPIDNQDLHQYSYEGADLLIICIPRLLPYAERIAESHRKKQGLNVVVATTEQCYNEFSAGNPDPMAYRALAKMLYMGKNQLKNILLFGPTTAECRGISVAKDPSDFIIAYQHELITVDRGAHNAYDYYGMMADYIGDLSKIERETMHVGVGLLPVTYESEALIVCDKIDNFLDDKSFAYSLNKILSIGGDLDKLQHAKQALELDSWIGKVNNKSSIFTPLVIETLGYDQAKRKTFEELNAGHSLMFYYGHGAEGYLGQNYKYFTPAEVARLRNTTLPFMLFAGCNLSKFDLGRRGIGETLVTATRFGAIASFFACRDTWSGQNQELFHTISRLMYKETDTSAGTRLHTPRTLGELLAAAKTESGYSNELAYVLVGDPALTLPLATGEIVLNDIPAAVAGNDIEVSGFIVDSKGESDNSFNGECVLRLMEPTATKAVQYVVHKYDGSQHDSEPLYVDYNNIQASMALTQVEDGMFKATIHVPDYCKQFALKDLRLNIAAYDTDRHLGAASKFDITLFKTQEGQPSDEEADKIPPTIDDISFDENKAELSVTVSDNYALGFSTNPLNRSFQVWIDGKEMQDASDHNPILSTDASCTRKVQLEGIAYGSHSARVRIKDAAGNETIDELVFIYQPGRGVYTLAAEFDADADTIRFGFEGTTPTAGRIHILNAEGKEVFAGPIQAGVLEWDRLSTNGTRIPAGHYKAFFIEHDNPAVNGHSQTIDIPLI
ncbi:MAG: C25 family cysteine peptidase [Muribaculum sp.]|nr:C25 family cysteine peptidase [Muribaculum sp.]